MLRVLLPLFLLLPLLLGAQSSTRFGVVLGAGLTVTDIQEPTPGLNGDYAAAFTFGGVLRQNLNPFFTLRLGVGFGLDAMRQRQADGVVISREVRDVWIESTQFYAALPLGIEIYPAPAVPLYLYGGLTGRITIIDDLTAYADSPGTEEREEISAREGEIRRAYGRWQLGVGYEWFDTDRMRSHTVELSAGRSIGNYAVREPAGRVQSLNYLGTAGVYFISITAGRIF